MVGDIGWFLGGYGSVEAVLLAASPTELDVRLGNPTGITRILQKAAKADATIVAAADRGH
jgi:hypothetical protein